ncbi:MAG: methyltransferase domain-containing protein [Alphaproteobacteria bacterium]|nr:MAG: methyltransferase domain-containing protein [Alphaproteobacteria bacterium]
MSDRPQTTRDALLGGRIHVEQPASGFRAGTDAVLLAAATEAVAGQRVLDLGCGVGTAALCLAARVPGLELHGLELQPAYAELARRNAAANDLSLTVHEGDVAAMPAALRARVFDHVILNPPFFPAGSASPAADPGRDLSRRDGTAGLAVWIDAGLRRLRPGGVLTLIQRIESLPEILACLSPRAGGLCVLPLAARPGRPAARAIVRGRKGARAGFRLLAPFILHDDGDSGRFSGKAEKIFREVSALSWSDGG